MNKKVIIIVIAIIVVLGAAFAIMQAKNKNKVASDSTSASGQSKASVDANKSEEMSFKGLLAGGSSKKCTYTNDISGVTSQGTVFVSGGKMRGDFEATVNDKTIMSHMISDGQVMSVWTDGQPTGFKMKFDASATGSGNAAASAQAQAQSVDPNKNYSFHCENWSADASVLTPPANIQFSDLTTITPPTVPGTSGDPKEMQKAVCARLTDPARTKCLESVK